MFMTPTVRPFNQQAHENGDAGMARKPGASLNSSARKPLADRSVNRKAGLNDPKPAKAKTPQLKVSPAESQPATKQTSPRREYPEWLLDVCSYKEVDDTYEDIWPSSQLLTRQDVMKIVKPKTPPPKQTFEIDPMLLELPPQNNFFRPSENHFLNKVFINEDDVGIPDFSF